LPSRQQGPASHRKKQSRRCPQQGSGTHRLRTTLPILHAARLSLQATRRIADRPVGEDDVSDPALDFSQPLLEFGLFDRPQVQAHEDVNFDNVDLYL